MAYVRCIVPVCPVRADATHRSEQVSQLLFGETATVLDVQKEFASIECSHDSYKGWCQTSQLTEVAGLDTTIALAAARENVVHCNGENMYVPFGSNLAFLRHGKTTVGNILYEYYGEIIVPEYKAEKLLPLAQMFLNTAYQWGGRSLFGIDCSGFTQMVFRSMGFQLQRDAYLQALQGQAVGFLQEAQGGDLAFFDNEQGRIVHVGILLHAESIIHASGKVRIDKMDTAGIINAETGIRTHNLRLIKRMV